MLKKQRPLVSVIMPAYNAEKFAEKAIQSILNQTLKNFELIIINDASSDKTLSIIKKFQKNDSRIKIITNNKNLQIASSLNIGIKHARSNFIARMDIDDFSYPDRLLQQYNLLKSNEKVAVVGTDMIIVDRQDKEISKREYPTESHELKKLMFRYSPFGHPTVMMRKDIFHNVGGYNETKVPCEDIDLWFKIGKDFEFASIGKALLRYRQKSSYGYMQQRDLELKTLQVRLQAWRKYDYAFSLYDLFYNITQFLTLWILPSNIRIFLYNFMRSRKYI